jgi:hypothetical protein
MTVTVTEFVVLVIEPVCETVTEFVLLVIVPVAYDF